jgi:uncharacterized protein (DUF433 family)
MLETRIVIDPEIRHGKPVIRDTRVPVELILGSLAGGMGVDEVAREYGVEKENVQAAIEYAARLLAKEEKRSMPDAKFLLDADMPRSSAEVFR